MRPPLDLRLQEAPSECSAAYSEIADEQLTQLEGLDDTALYDAVLDACELVFNLKARRYSTGIATSEGMRSAMPVRGHYPYKLCWSVTPQGPRIEAVYPRP